MSPQPKPSAGDLVEFRLRDVHFPDHTSILRELRDGDIVTGEVLELSRDARKEGDIFVSVHVEGLTPRCIVPGDRILRVIAKVRP